MVELEDDASAGSVGVHSPVPIRLNIGAGDTVFDGWLSVGLAEKHDIRCDVRSIPVPDDYADEAMAIHIIEHVFLWDVPAMLLEWKRILKPGAMLSIECPDLMKCCQNVIEGCGERMGLRGLYGELHGRDESMLHRWLPTTQQLRQLLGEAGFVKIKEKEPIFHGKRIGRDLRMIARKPENG